MKFVSIVPSLPHHLVLMFDDGSRTRLDIGDWLNSQPGLASMFTQGVSSADGIQWPNGQSLSDPEIEEMILTQMAGRS
jgi:hypothetical protein